jgi:hypothetical protein
MSEPPGKCPRKPKKLHESEAEIALIRAGYFRLSGTDKKVITGKAEALAFAQKAMGEGVSAADSGKKEKYDE